MEEDNVKFNFGFFYSGLIISRKENRYGQHLPSIKTTGGEGSGTEPKASTGSEDQLEGGSVE